LKKPFASHPAGFSDLFSRSIDIAKSLWKPVVLGAALVFGLFMALILLCILALGFVGPIDIQQPLRTGGLRDILFVLVLLLFVTFCIFIGWGASTYYQVLAVERPKRVREALRRVPSAMLPLAYSGVWMFLRSWTWVPLLIMPFAIGLVGGHPYAVIGMLVMGFLAIVACALAFTPRVSLAPVIVLAERVSPLQSVRLSEQRTRGYWVKVFCDVLLLGVILGVLSFGMQSLFGGLLQSFEWLLASDAVFVVKVTGVASFLFMGLLLCIVHALLQFVPLVFLVELHATLKGHPKT
jgi:hypothetical protein